MTQPKHQTVRDAQTRTLRSLQTRSSDGGMINYSGTADENYNREHYQKLMDILKTEGVEVGSKKPSALVLACGAGYGCFYLRAMGFNGSIYGEDMDNNSIKVAEMVRQYFKHAEVQETFLKSGLAETVDLIVDKYLEKQQASRSQLMYFAREDITRADNDSVHNLVVCDNIFSSEFLGGFGINHLGIRLNGLLGVGGILSCRYNTEPDKIRRLDFEKIAPQIYRKIKAQ